MRSLPTQIGSFSAGRVALKAAVEWWLGARKARPHESENEDTDVSGAISSNGFEIGSFRGLVADHMRRGRPFPRTVRNVITAVIRVRQSGDPCPSEQITQKGAARPGCCGDDLGREGHESRERPHRTRPAALSSRSAAATLAPSAPSVNGETKPASQTSSRKGADPPLAHSLA